LALAAIEAPAAPQRLPVVPGIEQGAASARDDEALRASLSVVVASVPNALLPSAGVAVFHTRTGGDLQWLPLASVTPTADGGRAMQLEVDAGEPLTVTLAADLTRARHGYLARRDVDATAAEATVTLDGALYPVQLELPPGAERAGPLLLQRTGDRQWLPRELSSGAVTLRRGATFVVELAADEYELLDPLAPSRAQRFRVEGPTSVTLREALAPAGADRR